MELGLLVTISCVLTGISMVLIIGMILFFARFGGQGVKGLIDRFTGANDEQANPEPVRRRENQPVVASSQSLRARARDLDFPAAPAQSAGQFSAQGAGGGNYPDFPPPQYQGQQPQASLRPRGQYPDFNPQAAQSNQGQNNFQLTTPSLSPSRPFQQGSQFRPNQGQQQQYNQQPANPNQFNQAPVNPNQFNQPSANPSQFNAQSAPQQGQNIPQQGGFPQQGFPQQGQANPQQAGFPQQGQANPQQGGFPQQGQANPQQVGLGQNRPPLRSRPRPDGNTAPQRGIGGRDRRKGDDYDRVYDDGGGNIGDDIGDFIDRF